MVSYGFKVVRNGFCPSTYKRVAGRDFFSPAIPFVRALSRPSSGIVGKVQRIPFAKFRASWRFVKFTCCWAQHSAFQANSLEWFPLEMIRLHLKIKNASDSMIELPSDLKPVTFQQCPRSVRARCCLKSEKLQLPRLPSSRVFFNLPKGGEDQCGMFQVEEFGSKPQIDRPGRVFEFRQIVGTEGRQSGLLSDLR